MQIKRGLKEPIVALEDGFERKVFFAGLHQRVEIKNGTLATETGKDLHNFPKYLFTILRAIS